VTEGHPDKLPIKSLTPYFDAVLSQDEMGRVACETLVTTGLVVVAGEITTNAHIDFSQVARDTIRDIGYTRAKFGFDCGHMFRLVGCRTSNPVTSLWVSTPVVPATRVYVRIRPATKTPELMPLPIQLAHQLTRRLSEVRRNGELPYLRPDGKSQVTVEYRDGRPFRVDAVVISSQHDSEVSQDKLRSEVLDKVIKHNNFQLSCWTKTLSITLPDGTLRNRGATGDAGVTDVR